MKIRMVTPEMCLVRSVYSNVSPTAGQGGEIELR